MAEIIFDKVNFTYPDSDCHVFSDFSVALPGGLVSLIGQNGTGKSTLMLLAGGVLLPDAGRVLVLGTDTIGLRDEVVRQRFVSIICQNLEFETTDPIGALLEYVYEHGFHERKDPVFLGELVRAFELSECIGRKTQEISKGELQRTILAFSFLYGSRIIMMDEPVFSLEQRQKIAAFEFIAEYVKRTGTSVYYSAHELEISERFSDKLVIFSKHGGIETGPTRELLTRERIEAAYEAPLSTLKQKEAIFREYLKK
jgi:iron complex transport system ATP-binding protein